MATNKNERMLSDINEVIIKGKNNNILQKYIHEIKQEVVLDKLRNEFSGILTKNYPINKEDKIPKKYGGAGYKGKRKHQS